MEDTITDPVPPLDEIQSSIADMLDILESSREDEEVKIYTERILLVDWLMASLLLFKEENRLLDIIQFAAFHQRLAQNVERWSDTLKPSYYVRAILLVGSVLVAQDVSIRSARKKDACDWLNQDAVEWHSVMRYDADRFQLLRDIVEGRIN